MNLGRKEERFYQDQKKNVRMKGIGKQRRKEERYLKERKNSGRDKECCLEGRKMLGREGE